MKLIEYGANLISRDRPYRYAYFKFMVFEDKKKAVVSGEVNMGSQRYFCISAQLGGDALFRVDLNFWNVEIYFSIWGYA